MNELPETVGEVEHIYRQSLIDRAAFTGERIKTSFEQQMQESFGPGSERKPTSRAEFWAIAGYIRDELTGLQREVRDLRALLHNVERKR